MVETYIAPGIISCLSTDTKPTRYAHGTQLIETDTGATYIWDGATQWWEDAKVHGLTIDGKKYSSWTAQVGNGGGTGLWSTITAISGIGTGTTNVVRASTGVGIRYDTGATVNSISGSRINGTGFAERDLNVETMWRIKGVVVTSCRIFIGYTSGTVNPASSADYLANLSGVGFWADTGVDTNWHIMQNNGSANSDITTIANVGALNTSFRTMRLRALNSGSKFQYSVDNSAWADINTLIPAASTGLGWIWYIESLTAASNNQIAFYRAWTKQDG